MVLREFFYWGNREPLNNPDTRKLVELSKYVVSTFRLAHDLEGEKRELVDFDLVKKDESTRRVEAILRDWFEKSPTRPKRQQILESFNQLESQVDQLPPPKDERIAMQQAFLKSKIQAFSTYQRVKMGQEIPTLEYIEQTMGIKPELIGEERLNLQKNRVKALLQRLGHDFTRKSVEDFRNKNRIEIDQAPALFTAHAKRLFERLSRFIGTKLDPSFDVEIVDEDKPWLFWASGTRGSFHSRVNKNKRHRDQGKFSRGKIEAMATHEAGGHFAQMNGWEKNIDREGLIPALGITSVYDQEQVTSEGIAQTLHYFVPEIDHHLSPEARIELEMEGLKQMIYNNVHIMINTQPCRLKDITSYVRKFLPSESISETRRQMSNRTRDDDNRTYLYAYGMGFVRHQWYAMNLNDNGKKELFRLIYSQPTTPAQEHEFVLRLLSSHDGRYGKINQTYEDFIGTSSDNAA